MLNIPHSLSVAELTCPYRRVPLSLFIAVYFADGDQGGMLRQTQRLAWAIEAPSFGDEDLTPPHAKLGSQPPWVLYKETGLRMPAVVQMVANRHDQAVSEAADLLFSAVASREYRRRGLWLIDKPNCFASGRPRYDVVTVWSGAIVKCDTRHFQSARVLGEYDLISRVVQNPASVYELVERILDVIEFDFKGEHDDDEE